MASPRFLPSAIWSPLKIENVSLDLPMGRLPGLLGTWNHDAYAANTNLMASDCCQTAFQVITNPGYPCIRLHALEQPKAIMRDHGQAMLHSGAPRQHEMFTFKPVVVYGTVCLHQDVEAPHTWILPYRPPAEASKDVLSLVETHCFEEIPTDFIPGDIFGKRTCATLGFQERVSSDDEEMGPTWTIPTAETFRIGLDWISQQTKSPEFKNLGQHIAEVPGKISFEDYGALISQGKIPIGNNHSAFHDTLYHALSPVLFPQTFSAITELARVGFQSPQAKDRDAVATHHDLFTARSVYATWGEQQNAIFNTQYTDACNSSLQILWEHGNAGARLPYDITSLDDLHQLFAIEFDAAGSRIQALEEIVMGRGKEST